MNRPRSLAALTLTVAALALAPATADASTHHCRIANSSPASLFVAPTYRGRSSCTEARHVLTLALDALSPRHPAATVAPSLGPWRCRQRIGRYRASYSCRIPRSARRRHHYRTARIHAYLYGE